MRKLLGLLLSLLIAASAGQPVLHAQDLSSLTLLKTEPGMKIHLYQVADLRSGQYSYTKDFSDAGSETGISLNALKTGNDLSSAAETLKGYAQKANGAEYTASGNTLKIPSLESGLYLLLVDRFTKGSETRSYLPYLIAVSQSSEVELSKYSTAEVHRYSLIKHWNGGTKIPDSVKVDIYNGSSLEKTVTLTKDSNYSCSWTSETPGNYSIREHPVSGYKASVSFAESNGTAYFVLTNTKTQGKKENGKKKSNTYKTPDDDTKAKKGTADEPDKHGADESGKHGTPSYDTGKKPSSGISSDKGQTPGTHANSQIRTGDETRIEIYVILFASAGLLLILAGRMLKKD